VRGEAKDKDYIEKEFDVVLNQIDSTVKSIKRISTHLRPEILDHLEIIDAVKWQAQQFQNITGITCTVSHLPLHFKLNPVQATTVYRSIQEALTNIMRHAKASAVKILLELNEEKLLVEVTDNGKGIRDKELESRHSLGLIGMRE